MVPGVVLAAKVTLFYSLRYVRSPRFEARGMRALTRVGIVDDGLSSQFASGGEDYINHQFSHP